MKSNADRKARIFFWCLAIALGALQAWGSRHFMDSDGVSYLDHGDAFFRGEWRMAVNPYWGPLYSWVLGFALFLLKPSPYWEYSVVHLVNFFIYLGALGCFEFFLRELTRYHQIRQEKSAREGQAGFSSPALEVLAYGLFIWSSLFLVNLREVTPDMLVAAFVYLACGVLLRMRRGKTSWFSFTLFGGVLGLGYLIKSPMLSLSLVFLGISVFSTRQPKKLWPRAVVAFAVFLLIASPYVMTISQAMGRLTFGESARWHYLVYINDALSYPKMVKIFDFPPVYEFTGPLQGTYPIWFDPAYWSKEIAPRYFDLKGLVHIWMLNAKRYYAIFFSTQSYLIVSFLLFLYLIRREGRGVKSLKVNGVLILPALTALAMYTFAPVFTRYIGPFVVLFWLALFSGVRLRDSHESRRLFAGVALCLVTMMGFQIAREEIPLVRGTVREILRGEEPAAHPMWLVARQLNRMGVKAGDPVASIGSYYHAFWARLARARIVAQIHHTDSANFWSTDPRVQSRALKAFASTGAKVIVAEKVPLNRVPKGWERIEGTDFFVRPLSNASS